MPHEIASLPPPRRYVFDQFFAFRRYIGNIAFSPDGKEVAYITDISGQFNIWRQPAQGGYPIQVTLFEANAVRSLAWSPDGETLVFVADRDGNEKHQLYSIPRVGGWPSAHTSRPDVQYLLASRPFSPDGRLVAYAGNERHPSDVDVFVRDMETGVVRSLIAATGYFIPVDWSPNGKFLTVVNLRGMADTDIYLLDVATAKRILITKHKAQEVSWPVGWKRDSSGFYFLSHQGEEFVGLYVYNRRTEGISPVLRIDDWDLEQAAVSPDGHLLAWSVNENGESRLFIREVAGKQPLKTPIIPRGVIETMTFSPDSNLLIFRLSQPTWPPEMFVLNVKARRLSQITFGMIGGVHREDLVAPDAVSYPTWDGRHIPALLYKPKGLLPGQRVPALVSVHGGPHAQERPTYNPLYQYLLNRGIGILAPNIRGSAGYGRTYQCLIHRDWGGGELRDIEHAALYLRSLPWVDGSRLGIYGESFGGFATLSAVTRLPQYWAAAVDIMGPSNLVTFAKAVPPTWRRFMTQWVGDPDKDRDRLIERSPIMHVDSIRAPLLVIQGANDPRVAKTESDQIVERLRAKGIAVEYLVFDDEGHGFTRRVNQFKALKATAEFFERHLLPQG
jgi:dipeptidyl aminopeptidase/acylaminoacyl peptidase